MAVFGSLLLGRTLKQFINCKNPDSEEGRALADKIRAAAPDSLEKILEAIPNAGKRHGEILKQVCDQLISQESEDHFLDNLTSETTAIRAVTRELLSESQQISPAKLFRKLQDDNAPVSEIIEVLELQKDNIPPELFVKNALKMNRAHADKLFEFATSNAEKTDLSALAIDFDALENLDVKIKLIRFLAAVEKSQSARMIMRLLGDESKIIQIEALNRLKHMQADFDPGPIVKHIARMSDDNVETAFEILELKLSAESVPALTLLMTGKNDQFRERACRLLLPHINQQSLEALLLALDVHEWWGKEQAVKCLLDNGDDNLFLSANGLIEHANEFVRGSAEQLAAKHSGGSRDIREIAKSLLHEDWQVREMAIGQIGASANRDALSYLAAVIEKFPESSIAVLKAVSRLGFSKGLEIATRCLRMKEAAIEREALYTIIRITTRKHADNVRRALIKLVPSLQATVRDTAQEVVHELTDKYGLAKLELDEESLFETRLLKIDQQKNQTGATGIMQGDQPTMQMEKTEVVSFQQIEELKPGDFWMNRFRIVREIGRGAMGRVMLVEDETVGETLILKFMHPELTSDGSARERFLRELKYARKISHPNVIRIHDYLTHEGISAISMEYFESEGLDNMIKNKLLTSTEQSLSILYQVSDGMWAAHQQNVIHRDLKPSNILVNDAGQAKVVDFGIASATSETEATLTKTGMIIGTPAYLSPERAKGLEADARSDIYALGIIAYSMFHGSPPYKGEPMSLLFQHIEGKATPLHRTDIKINIGISMLVEKMMAVDVDKRYQTMKDVRDTIKQLK